MDRIAQRKLTAALSTSVGLLEAEAFTMMRLAMVATTDMGLKPHLRGNARKKLLHLRELENLLEEVMEADPEPESERVEVTEIEAKERQRIIKALNAGISAVKNQAMEYTFKRILVVDGTLVKFLGLRIDQLNRHMETLEELREDFMDRENLRDYEEANSVKV